VAAEDIAVDAQNIDYADTGTSEVWQVDKRTFATTLLASAQARAAERHPPWSTRRPRP